MFAKPTMTVAIAGLLGAFPALINAQVPKLAELVEVAGGKPIRLPVLTETSWVSIDELAATADFVVDARLVRLGSYVSEDGTKVFTDYQIVPNRVVVSRTGDVGTVPGSHPPLVLTVLGGEVTIEGTLVTMTDAKMTTLRDRGQFLLFAKRAKTGQTRFALSRGSASIFEIVDGEHVEPLLRRQDPNPDVEGIALEKIVARVQAAAARK